MNEELKNIDCERTLEYILWKIQELDTEEEIHEYIKSMLRYIHAKNMEEIESKLPIVLTELTVKAPKEEIKP
jgi:hypothetical protein